MLRQGRNRRCITVDLHKVEGRGIIKELAERSDILVENFRPGVNQWSKLTGNHSESRQVYDAIAHGFRLFLEVLSLPRRTL